MERERVLATERYGSLGRWSYRPKDEALEREREGGDNRWTRSSFLGVLKSVFLPQGYPESVSEDYLQYQLWDTVQAFCSSLSGTLSTQASLRGVGVGSGEATVAAATVTWLLRDGTGMLGRILFAWVKGSKLDCDAKQWRLVADILNDIAMFMEIVAPNFPACFTLIVCTAGIFKSIVGVAGGATRAALTMHQARRDNMADVSAKDGSQETLVNLAGLLISLLLIPLVTDSTLLTFALFFIFTVFHLLANYRAVRSVVMETLNEARLSILLHHYLRDGRILSPSEANQRESVFLGFKRSVSLKLGVRLGDVVSSPEELELALINNDKPYLIGLKPDCVCVCLGEEVTVSDEIQSACQAMCVATVLLSQVSEGPLDTPLEALAAARTRGPRELLAESRTLIDKIFPPFLEGLKVGGWQVTHALLDWDEWRVDWKKKRE
ncbi:RUS1 family protein C16orf58 homolog [Conger conger]|nr:RUS1 family protein C16orf58 homolog [Conger conger]XP_061080052.1 RUS1 family protein C16orf58 homolog [Conger conger]XP_061080053.1 RUS1 family protein C16orf58 homolog [Conger conger]XP_061080054.1 RUS1 family protein C16orf58 homolog [Conger conger]